MLLLHAPLGATHAPSSPKLPDVVTSKSVFRAQEYAKMSLKNFSANKRKSRKSGIVRMKFSFDRFTRKADDKVAKLILKKAGKINFKIVKLQL